MLWGLLKSSTAGSRAGTFLQGVSLVPWWKSAMTTPDVCEIAATCLDRVIVALWRRRDTDLFCHHSKTYSTYGCYLEEVDYDYGLPDILRRLASTTCLDWLEDSQSSQGFPSICPHLFFSSWRYWSRHVDFEYCMRVHFCSVLVCSHNVKRFAMLCCCGLFCTLHVRHSGNMWSVAAF